MEKKLIKEINNFRKNIGLKTINEVSESHVNANSLKSYLSGIGYKTQTNMDDYGDLTPKFAEIIMKVAKTLKDNLPNVKFTFGSGNDKFHRKFGNSRHTKGNAIDVTFSGGDSDKNKTLDDISIILCSARKNIDGFTFIDEYRHPSAHATGGHFHLSYSENARDESRHVANFCKTNNQEGSLDNFKFDKTEKLPTGDFDFEKVLDNIGLDVFTSNKTEDEIANEIKSNTDLIGKNEKGEWEVMGYGLSDIIKTAKDLFSFESTVKKTNLVSEILTQKKKLIK